MNLEIVVKLDVQSKQISHSRVIMDKWEYKVIPIYLGPGLVDRKKNEKEVASNIQKNLNLLGKDGWEMLQTISRFKTEFILFKRKKLPKN